MVQMAISSDKPDLNNDFGFTSKKYATKKIVKGPDGRPQVVFVDPKTGKTINNPKGYTVIESSNVIDPALNAQSSPVTTSKGQTLQSTDPNETSMTDEVRGIQRVRGENPNITAAKSSQSQDQNMGYVSKPAGMGLLGFLPGPLGLAATLGNVGINASNTDKVNDQREALGFTENSLGKNVLGAVSDQKGYIGDQSTIDQSGANRTTPVSFESEDPVGRTTLTPNEARMREQLNPDQYSEASKASIDNAREKFQQEHPNWMSSLSNSAKNLFSGMFGGKTATTDMKSGGVGSYGNGFPTKPSKPSNTTTGIDSGRAPSVDTTGFSPGLW